MVCLDAVVPFPVPNRIPGFVNGDNTYIYIWNAEAEEYEQYICNELPAALDQDLVQLELLDAVVFGGYRRIHLLAINGLREVMITRPVGAVGELTPREILTIDPW